MAKKIKRRIQIEKPIKLKACAFCKDDAPKIDFKDIKLLRKYLSDRGKIRSRRVTGLCARHQKEVAVAVKNARELALLPFISIGR